MESLKKFAGKAKSKAGEGMFGFVEDLLKSIDPIEQIYGLVKEILPMKAVIEVKGKEAIEIKALERNEEIFVRFRRLKKKPETVEPEEEETEE